MAGPDRASPIALDAPGGPFARPARTRLRGVRMAWWTALWAALPVDPVRDAHAVDAQRRIFEALGCIVEDDEPDFADFDEIFKTVRALRS